MDGIYFVMNQMVIKNIPQSGLFLTVEYCVDSVENFHTLLCNHSIFRYDNFIGCFSADKIKMSVRK